MVDAGVSSRFIGLGCLSTSATRLHDKGNLPAFVKEEKAFHPLYNVSTFFYIQNDDSFTAIKGIQTSLVPKF